MIASILKGQDVTFIPAGKAAGYSKYNLVTSTANGNDGAGGFSFVGESFGATTTYRVTASFDGGTTFNNIPSATATTGTWNNNGLFTTDGAGEMQIAFAHSRLTSMANWPGSVNSGTINLRVTNIATGTHHPGPAGSHRPRATAPWRRTARGRPERTGSTASRAAQDLPVRRSRSCQAARRRPLS